jgi:hypothetical protein
MSAANLTLNPFNVSIIDPEIESTPDVPSFASGSFEKEPRDKVKEEFVKTIA